VSALQQSQSTVLSLQLDCQRHELAEQQQRARLEAKTRTTRNVERRLVTATKQAVRAQTAQASQFDEVLSLLTISVFCEPVPVIVHPQRKHVWDKVRAAANACTVTGQVDSQPPVGVRLNAQLQSAVHTRGDWSLTFKARCVYLMHWVPTVR
jgi:hypothetical protein